MQRARQFGRIRAIRAADAVYEHRLRKHLENPDEKSLAKTKEAEKSKKFATSNALERIVEDKIAESMARGEFDNLAGAGKPLKPPRSDSNPFADFTANKMNEILVEGGFAPEWITLGKEIAEERRKIRDKLQEKRKTLGPNPLNKAEMESWRDFCTTLRDEDVMRLNKKVDKFNLVVPLMTAQVFRFDIDAEVNKIIFNY